MHDFVDENGLDLALFRKGQRKDDLTQLFLADHDGSEGVLYVGVAQEKATVMRTERRYGPTGTPVRMAGQGVGVGQSLLLLLLRR